MTEPCDLSALEARRLIGARKLSPVELLDSCLARIEATNGAVNAIVAMDASAARTRASEIEQAIRPRRGCGAARRPAHRHQGPAGDRRAADHAGLAAVQGRRADERRRRRGTHPQRRRRDPRQDQHARVRRRRQHDQPRVRSHRQSVRPDQDLRRLLRRLGRGAGAGPGAAGHGHRLRRQPAHTGRVLRRGGLPPFARRGADHRCARISLSPFSVTGPMAPHHRRRAPAAARPDRRGQGDPFSSSDYARIPARAHGRRPRQAARRRLARSRLRAGRSRHCAESSASASRASGRPSRRCRSARPTSAACTRSSRCCAACTSSPTPRAAGEGARAARPQRHRQHRARAEALARRRLRARTWSRPGSTGACSPSSRRWTC